MPFQIQPTRLFTLLLGLAALLRAFAIPAASALPAIQECFKKGAAAPPTDARPLIRKYCKSPNRGALECLTSRTGLRWRIQTCDAPGAGSYDACVSRLDKVLSSCLEPSVGTSNTRGGREIENGCESMIDPNAGSCEKDEHL